MHIATVLLLALLGQNNAIIEGSAEANSLITRTIREGRERRESLDRSASRTVSTPENPDFPATRYASVPNEDQRNYLRRGWNNYVAISLYPGKQLDDAVAAAQRELKAAKNGRQSAAARIKLKQLRIVADRWKSRELPAIRRKLRANNPPWMPTMALGHPLSIGRVGYAPVEYDVLQVTSETSALVEYLDHIDESIGKPIVMVRGVSMRGVTNGGKLDLTKTTMAVTGTETYKTAGGSTNTVFVMERFVLPEKPK